MKKFAIHILNEVAEKCEDKMNSFKTPEKTAVILDKVSENITEFLYEMSRDEVDSSK